MTTEIKIRRDMAAAWTLEDPILAEGEAGIELDDLATTGARLKFGNGVDAWSALPYSFDAPVIDLEMEKRYKNANEVVNNSSALQDDDTLFFAAAAGEVWAVHWYLALSGSAAGIASADAKFNCDSPAGSTVKQAIMGHGLGISATEADVKLQSFTGGTGLTVGVSVPASANNWAHFWALVEVGGTAGNIKLQWAQAAANAVDLRVERGSHMIAHKMN